MSKNDTNTDNTTKSPKQIPSLPWIPLLKLPRMNFRRPKIQMPHNAPHQYITILLVVFSAFLLAGGIYNLAEKNVLPLGFTESGYQPIFPGLNDQFLVESFSILIFVLLGTLGIFLLRQTTVAAKEGEPASFMLVLGVVLIVVGITSAILMIQLKIGPIF
ncbi:MAG: hypothetical protein HeimC3_06310 [Candidatus Heimdallarchaeota archaeon LC_3]|nr:MAG: hypothetical protein HeimC3_06310 [Candidatus Heimdallarchaeota archaeon LC_3]